MRLRKIVWGWGRYVWGWERYVWAEEGMYKDEEGMYRLRKGCMTLRNGCLRLSYVWGWAIGWGMYKMKVCEVVKDHTGCGYTAEKPSHLTLGWNKACD
jgi:hypothetical protein